MSHEISKSHPPVSIKNYNSPVICQGGQLIVPIRDVLKGINLAIVDDGVVVPESLSMGERELVIVFDGSI